jgi:hypothetical protein
MEDKSYLIRNLEANAYRENFIVSAFVTIITVRLFLKFTAYPQLGFGDLHIAHMFWGGLLMMASIFILLSFLNKQSASVASILGGVGFGLFIDELGKIITKENDYFFEPTVAYIYIIFVLLYLISRFIPRYRAISKKEYLVNAMEMIKESASNDFDKEEERRAKEYLKHCDKNSYIVQTLRSLLSHIDALPVSKPNIYTRGKQLLRLWYYKVAGSDIILKGVIFFLALQTFRILVEAALLLIARPDLSFAEWGKVGSSVLAGIFSLIGFFALRFSKAEAYRFFRIAILITLFLTEFFAFMSSQWYELFGLFATVFILVVINYAQALERAKQQATS